MTSSSLSLSRGPYEASFEARATFRGPLHVGTGQRLATTTDAPLLRDASGRVWLPGSSIRGVLRDWCEREASMVGADARHLRRLFGATPIDEHPRKAPPDGDRQGRLRVFDARLDPEAPPTEIRDHVRHDPRWGAAATGAKFDHELALPQAATLRLSYEGDGPADTELALLRSSEEALVNGVLGFGAKSGWGFGGVRAAACTWRARDRRTPEGLSVYLRSRLPGNGTPADPAALPAPDYSRPRARHEGEPKPWSWLSVDLRLQFDGPMLVAGPVRAATPSNPESAADATYFVDGCGRPVLPGSSLRGVLRNTASRIAQRCGQSALRDLLFGYRKTTVDGKERGQRGLLSVGEGFLGGERRVLPFNHNANDRVSGFTADQKLFSVAPLISPSFTTPILLRWHADDDDQRAAIGLFLMTLREAVHGLIWCGSRTTRGYGRVSSSAVLAAQCSTVDPQGAIWQRRPLRRLAENDVTLAGLGELDRIVEAWRTRVRSAAGAA